MTSLPRLDVDEAAHVIVAALQTVASERITLDRAPGRILASDLVAGLSLPPWTNASMDGYAVRGEEVRNASSLVPRRIRLAGASRAGGSVAPDLAPGTAMRIFTGAPVPAGADSVIRQEDTSEDGEYLVVQNDRDVKANIRLAGGDVAVGSVVLASGESLDAGAIAVMAALGVSHPTVRQRPRVGILVTGDELVPVTEGTLIETGRRLADVNGPMLATLVRQAGGEPVMLGIARDDPDEIRAAIGDSPHVDLLVTAGGVSVGTHDHVPGVMASLGVKLAFRRVRVRPGGPTAFGLFPDRAPWLGLPGNPVSAFVTFHLFGRPAIRRLLGVRNVLEPAIPVTISQDIARDQVLDLYHRVHLAGGETGGPPVARLTGAQGSGMLRSIIGANALLRIESGTFPAAAGSVQRAIPCLRDGHYLSG